MLGKISQAEVNRTIQGLVPMNYYSVIELQFVKINGHTLDFKFHVLKKSYELVFNGQSIKFKNRSNAIQRHNELIAEMYKSNKVN